MTVEFGAASDVIMTNNYSGSISMKVGHPDSSSHLKALVAATPVLGAAARSLACMAGRVPCEILTTRFYDVSLVCAARR